MLNRLVILFSLTLVSSYAMAIETVLSLSDKAQQAIDHGVTITINSDYRQPEQALFGWLSHNKTRHSFIIQRHTLSNRYTVTLDQLPIPRVFRSLPQVMDYVAFQSLKLLESYNTTEQDSLQQHYEMRVSLNKYELPSPLRLKAFFSDEWDNDSGWLAWQSKN